MNCVYTLGGRLTPLLGLNQKNNVALVRNLTEGLFGGFLTTQWNRVDAKRLKEVGPDRLCAEWLLRCGGTCKVANRTSWHTDYNALNSFTAKTRVEAMDCTKGCVNSGGFRHVHGLVALKAIKIDFNLHFCDAGLGHLDQVKDTLTRLRISNCPQITDAGLTTHIPLLKNLEILHLASLPAVENMDKVVAKLKSELLKCDIVTDYGLVAQAEPYFFA